MAAILKQGERFLPGYIGETKGKARTNKGKYKYKNKYKDMTSALGKDQSNESIPFFKGTKAKSIKAKSNKGKYKNKYKDKDKYKYKDKTSVIGNDQSNKSIPFFFVHINKTGEIFNVLT